MGRSLIDFHAHILPGADHGSDSLETSLWQLSEAKKHGVNRIIATPHFYPQSHSLDRFIERRNKAYQLLKAELDGSVSVRLGAEAMLCVGFDHLPNLDKLFVENTNLILIELPFSGFDQAYLSSVKEMRKQGIEVLLAHAERYSSSDIEQLLHVGALVQINAETLASLFPPKHVLKWIDAGQVVAIGSDMHKRDKKAYKCFSKVAEKYIKPGSAFAEFSEKIWK